MAPVLCIMTTGDMHHEDALQGRSRYRYVSALLLFSHHRHELNVLLRLGTAKVLGELLAVRSRARALLWSHFSSSVGCCLSISDHDPRKTIITP